jgi:hypothetical protein
VPPKEDFDTDENDWIDVVEAHWSKFPGNINATVQVERTYELQSSQGNTDGERITLFDKRRSAKKMRRIARIFHILIGFYITITIVLASIGIAIMKDSMDLIKATLPAMLFVLLSLLFLYLGTPPHYRLTRQNDELCIEKWISQKGELISNSTTRASLHLYKVKIEHSRFFKLLGLLGTAGSAIPAGKRKHLVLVYWIDGKQEIFGLDPNTVIFPQKIDEFIEGFSGLA